MTFDPHEVRQQIDKLGNTPAVIAEVDQRQAALKDALNVGTWWSSLIALSREREKDVAEAAAMVRFRSYLSDLPEEMLGQLVVFLMTDTLHRIATYEYDGDIARAVASAFDSCDYMPNANKFVDTQGQSCSFCGHDDGWSEHDCDVKCEHNDPEQV